MSDTTKETIARLRAACDALDGLSIHNDWECRMVRATALPKLLDAVEAVYEYADKLGIRPGATRVIGNCTIDIITDALAGLEVDRG